MATLPSLSGKVALITGAARRIGAAISRCLHADGANIIVHYRGSADEAMTLCDELNALRPNSAMPIQADLADRGLNPLGLAKGVVPFDLDPYLLTPAPASTIRRQTSGVSAFPLEEEKTS